MLTAIREADNHDEACADITARCERQRPMRPAVWAPLTLARGELRMRARAAPALEQHPRK